MSNLQTHWSEAEILATDAVVEPLVVAGVRCHGGFNADGEYVSPRTKYRVPATRAWQESHRETFGTEIIDAPLATWPGSYPDVAEAKYLLSEGVRGPIVTTLTRIGTVEGFGAMIRGLGPGDLQRFFDESIDGTCLSHLQRGLFEAQARDEAGWDEEAGHRDMWFAARDIAFEHPVTPDETRRMLERMGISGGPPANVVPAKGEQPAAPGVRLFDDLDPGIEGMARFMLGLLFIELSAFHTFAWAEAVLSDENLVAGGGEAARIVSYIRADETPHVEYLKTALTEIRDRTLIGESGRHYAGADVIDRMWDFAMTESREVRRPALLRATLAEVEHALAGNRRRAEILEGFHACGTLRPDARGELVALVKFGIFYEHQLPRPWEAGSEYRLIQDALEEIELADALGIDYVWEVEHHFLEEYSHSSAPEVFLAAASQRTKRIRLGHGIVQTPPAFNHPARIVERIAMLDLVSGGRVDFGTGESSSEAELGGFMIEPENKRAMWEEGLRVAVRCMSETPFTGHSGDFVTMPPRNVVPKPMQRPHPPLWVACSRRETIHLAAQHAMGALVFVFVDPEEAKHWVDDYYSTLASEGVPIGDAVNANVAVVTTFMCDRDEETALARGIEGANFFGYSLAHYYVFGRHVPAGTDVWAEYQARRAEHGFDPVAVAMATRENDRLGARVVQDGFGGLRGAIGTPDQIRDYLRRYEACGVDQVIFCSQAGKNRHEHIMESLELFGKEVLPEFAEREPQRTRDKEQRLAPVVDAVMARKPASDHPPLPTPDYSFPAIPRAMADRSGSDDFQQMLDKIADATVAGESPVEQFLRN